MGVEDCGDLLHKVGRLSLDNVATVLRRRAVSRSGGSASSEGSAAPTVAFDSIGCATEKEVEKDAPNSSSLRAGGMEFVVG
jgi:hypothetical protein